jgi:hypothetical protein
VPLVAWELHVHTQDVRLTPTSPAVVFRVKTTPVSGAVPRLQDVPDAKTLATGGRWRILGACGSASG